MHSNPSQSKQFCCDSSIYLNSYCHQRTVERDKHRFSISLSLSGSVYKVLISRSQNAGQLCIGIRGGGYGLYLVQSEEYFVRGLQRFKYISTYMPLYGILYVTIDDKSWVIGGKYWKALLINSTVMFTWG